MCNPKNDHIYINHITYSNRTVNMYYALLHLVKTHKKKPNNNNKEKPTQQQQKHDLNKIKLH